MTRQRSTTLLNLALVTAVGALCAPALAYSFAVMTYQLLTGHKPFERNNTWAMIRSHLEEPPPDPRIHVDLPDIAADALLKALAKKPEERFASVGELVAVLHRAC